MLHNKNTEKRWINDNTNVYETTDGNIKAVHLRHKQIASWTKGDEGVVNLEIERFVGYHGLEFDITETSLISGHEKRVMFSLKVEEVQALRDALDNLLKEEV